MAARTVVCPECSEKLPYGRLSCPACGSLLAAVAGGRAREVAVPTPPPAVAAAEPEPPAPAEVTPEARPRRRWRAKQGGSSASEEPQPVAAAAATGPAPMSAPSPVAAAAARRIMLAPSKVGAVTLAARLEATPAPPALPPPVLGDWPADAGAALGGPSPWRRDGVQRPRDEDLDPVEGQRRDALYAGGGNGSGADGTGTRLPAWAGGPPASSGPLDLPAAVAPVALDRTTAGTPPPGAYLPPSGTFSARDSGLPRGELVLPGSARIPMEFAPRAGKAAQAASAPAVEPASKPHPGSSSLLADLSFETPKSLPGWLVAAGSAAAIAGFLLPWSRMIPGAGGFGYLDTWGLASSSRVLLLLMTVVALAMAILPNRVPAWIRTGVAGLVVGGLLLGIVWPYLLDGASAIGTLAEAVAAMLLIIGGLLAVRPQRHAEVEPGV